MLLDGLTGGFAAAIVMAVLQVLFDGPSPSTVFWSNYVGGSGSSSSRLPGLLLHLLYGVVAGGLFVFLMDVLGVSLVTATAAVMVGLVWGLLLFVVGVAWWMVVVLGLEPTRRRVVASLILHLLYGVVLGGWLHLNPLALS